MTGTAGQQRPTGGVSPFSSHYIAVGYECNHRCITCPCTTADRLHRPLSLGELDALLDEIGDDSTAHVIISGGEPTLHKDFLAFLTRLSRQHALVTVLSNSDRFSDVGFAERLAGVVEPGRLTVVTTIHAQVPNLHDEITGSAGSFVRTMCGLKNLLSCGITVCVKHIFSRPTYEALPKFVGFVDQEFPAEVGLELCGMDFVGRAAKNSEKLAVSFHELKPLLEGALDLLEGSHSLRAVRVSDTPLCASDPYYWRYFQHGGKMLTNYVAPNVANHRATDVPSQCGAFYPECQRCVVRVICPGAWQSAYDLMGNGLLKPIQGVQ